MLPCTLHYSTAMLVKKTPTTQKKYNFFSGQRMHMKQQSIRLRTCVKCALSAVFCKLENSRTIKKNPSTMHHVILNLLVNISGSSLYCRLYQALMSSFLQRCNLFCKTQTKYRGILKPYLYCILHKDTACASLSSIQTALEYICTANTCIFSSVKYTLQKLMAFANFNFTPLLNSRSRFTNYIMHVCFYTVMAKL